MDIDDIEFYDNEDGYIIGGHDAEYRKKDNRQKCGDRKRGSLQYYIILYRIKICLYHAIGRILV